jgi:hypothetical protein
VCADCVQRSRSSAVSPRSPLNGSLTGLANRLDVPSSTTPPSRLLAPSNAQTRSPIFFLPPSEITNFYSSTPPSWLLAITRWSSRAMLTLLSREVLRSPSRGSAALPSRAVLHRPLVQCCIALSWQCCVALSWQCCIVLSCSHVLLHATAYSPSCITAHYETLLLGMSIHYSS